jgi:hypothetical protein
MRHSEDMRTSTALTATTWVGGAGLAAAGVTVVLSILGHELLGSSGPVLTQAQVRADLAQPAPAPAPARAGAAASHPAVPPGAWTAREFGAGTIFAACVGGQATLTDWIPAQGYRTAGFAAGPAAAASVRFASASATLVVTVTCPHDRPSFSTAPAAPPAAAPTPAPPASPPASGRPAATITPPPADQGGHGGGQGSGGGHGGGSGHGHGDG